MLEKDVVAAGDAGFMRLPEVLRLVPVGKSRWFSGVRSGEFPRPLKLGRASLYRRKDIQALLAKIEREGAGA